MHSHTRPLLLTLVFLVLYGYGSHAGHLSKGLWVGEVALDAVNEATGAVGDSNTYEFTDPLITTPTSDTAYLRLILHVNGAGQVSLLKSVAVVEGDTLPDGTTDLLLLTDPSLYPNYPGLAKRIASAFFDYGDPKAVEAVQVLIDTARDTAVARALAGDDEATIIQLLKNGSGTGALDLLVSQADVDTAYLDRGTGASSFITTGFFTLDNVHAIADEVASQLDLGPKMPADFDYDPGAGSYAPFASDPVNSDFSTVLANAEALETASFYNDTRGIRAIVNVVVAAVDGVVEAGAATLPEKQASARLAAESAWHNAADVTQEYNRFLASDAFTGLPSAVVAPAVQAAIDAESRGEAEPDIVIAVRDALLLEMAVQDAYTGVATFEAGSLNQDTRARRTVDALIDSTADAAAAQVLVDTDATLLAVVVSAAVENTYNAIDASPVFQNAPSVEYSDFVRNPGYDGAAATAAETAASEAYFQFINGLTDADDLKELTEGALLKALVGIRNQAAALEMHSAPLSGSLEAGGQVDGEIVLPALAPTNPFLHRLHPDHTVGFPVTRTISMTVDPPASGDFVNSGYGVSTLTGTYLEEIQGLHKPLGNAQDTGLKTQGTFTLNRLTLVDTLNF